TMATFSGQIDPTNIVTMNGPGTLNLFGNNTLAGLVFNNNGGGAAGNAVATVNTTSVTTGPGVTTGTLTLTGPTAILATSSYVNSTPVFNGRINLSGSSTIQVDPVVVNGQNVNLLVSTLNIQTLVGSSGTIHKTGNGVLG